MAKGRWTAGWVLTQRGPEASHERRYHVGPVGTLNSAAHRSGQGSGTAVQASLGRLRDEGKAGVCRTGSDGLSSRGQC